MKWIQLCSNEGVSLFQREIDSNIVKMNWCFLNWSFLLHELGLEIIYIFRVFSDCLSLLSASLSTITCILLLMTDSRALVSFLLKCANLVWSNFIIFISAELWQWFPRCNVVHHWISLDNELMLTNETPTLLLCLFYSEYFGCLVIGNKHFGISQWERYI